jgi:hypothetical protein
MVVGSRDGGVYAEAIVVAVLAHESRTAVEATGLARTGGVRALRLHAVQVLLKLGDELVNGVGHEGFP